MKKSAKVTLAFLSSFAAAVMNGCDSNDGGDWVEAKRCVDNDNLVVDNELCEGDGPNRRALLPLLWRPRILLGRSGLRSAVESPQARCKLCQSEPCPTRRFRLHRKSLRQPRRLHRQLIFFWIWLTV